jgi:SAM-dependent methyltransferase
MTGRLGDTPARDYSSKLKLFNAFAEPELREVIASLELKKGMRILDVGCGTGEALQWLLEAVTPGGSVVGIDLAAAHVDAARLHQAPGMQIFQADLLDAPLAAASFDVVWSVNTIHHLQDPLLGVERLAALVRPGGRLAMGQSSFLPDMVFAWDSQLERLTHEAVRRYYQDRYDLDERDLTAVRSLVGLLRQAGISHVAPRTVMIERVSPLDPASEAYLLEAIFKNTWGERLRPYLSPDHYVQLGRLCDPLHREFALRRPDFHLLQSLSFVVGEVEPSSVASVSAASSGCRPLRNW